MKRYAQLLLPALICGFGLAACEPDDRADLTVARVGDGAITATDLTDTLLAFPKAEQVEYLTDDGKIVLVELLIDRRLAAQAAREEGFDQQPDVAVAIAAAARPTHADRILENAYLNSRLAAVSDPTATELQRYYDDNPQEFRQPQRIQVQRIFFQTRAAAEAAMAELSPDPDFEAYKRARPTVPITVDALWLRPRDEATELEAAAFALAPGELSEILETRAGYALMRIMAEEPARQLSLDAAMPRLVARVTRQRNARELQAIRAELRDGVEIEVDGVAVATYRCAACVPGQ